MRKKSPTGVFIALLVGGCAASGSAVTHHSRSGAELLAAAEHSFSDIPFGVREPPPSLTLIYDGGCVAGRGECSYIDANHVMHYFDDGELVVKSIELGKVGTRPIAALGIGKARALDEVVAQVRRFLPEAEVSCDKNGKLKNALHECGATLGDGWVKLFFDTSGRLDEVRVDAYQFT